MAFPKMIKNWKNDASLRIKVSLYGALIWNTAYAVLHMCLGFWYHTFWYYSLAGYYICLAVMRYFLARHTSKYKPGERMRGELIKYRVCGIVFLVMNLVLTMIIFFMVYWNRTFIHHEITTITMATYTFTAFTVAIINMVKYRKYNSPVFDASKSISLAAACVSMLTLECTMLKTFDNETMSESVRRIFLALSGGAISLVIVTMALYMIIQSNKKLKQIKNTKEK